MGFKDFQGQYEPWINQCYCELPLTDRSGAVAHQTAVQCNRRQWTRTQLGPATNIDQWNMSHCKSLISIMRGYCGSQNRTIVNIRVQFTSYFRAPLSSPPFEYYNSTHLFSMLSQYMETVATTTVLMAIFVFNILSAVHTVELSTHNMQRSFASQATRSVTICRTHIWNTSFMARGTS